MTEIMMRFRVSFWVRFRVRLSVRFRVSFRVCFRVMFRVRFNSQAPVSPELASRGVFRLSRLSLNSQVKTVKQYTPQIEYGEFFDIISFSVKRLWKPQNAYEKNRQRFYLLWFLLVLYFWPWSLLISVQSLKIQVLKHLQFIKIKFQ